MPFANARASQRFIGAVWSAMGAELGRELPLGTTVIASHNREGSNAAVSYPLGGSTAVLCAPRLAARLAFLDGGAAVSNEAFVAAATTLGATSGTCGCSRVFEGVPSLPDLDPDRVVALERDRGSDRALIAAFMATCSKEDLDAAELEMEHLDRVILGVRSDDATLGALAFGRPWARDDGFDDVGMLTAPDQRGRGLGWAAVAHLVGQQHERGRLALYNCDVDNVASNRLADSLGFILVQTIASVRFA